MTASVIVGIFGGTALVAAPLAAARAAATAGVGDEHAAARLVTAVEATGSGHTVDARSLDLYGHRMAYLLAHAG